jgi:hypothetical protein
MATAWLPVPGFPEYAVSEEGAIKRVVEDRRRHGLRLLKPWLGNHGYETVSFASEGKLHRRLVHRIVCEAFHGPAPTPAHHVAHGDGTRRNNRAANLRWATRSENMEDSRRHGSMALGARHGRTVCPERTPRGERHGHAKLTEADVRAIRAADRQPGSGRSLAASYGVSPGAICLIRSGKTWNHVESEDQCKPK